MAGGGGGDGLKCPDQFLFATAISFSRKHAIKLFDFSLTSVVVQ